MDRAEERLTNFDSIGADIDAVKRQIKELKDFKNEVDPMMVKVEALNRSVESLSPHVLYVYSLFLYYNTSFPKTITQNNNRRLLWDIKNHFTYPITKHLEYINILKIFVHLHIVHDANI